MTRLYWWMVGIASEMLEPVEREAVRGDIAESGETGFEAFRDVLGLVVRRQVECWKHWRPWIALIALVLPLASLLALTSLRTADGSAIYFWLYVNNWAPGYLAEGFRVDLARNCAAVCASFVGLMCWSWTSGFALGSVSRRSIPINGALFCLVLLVAVWTRPPTFFGHRWFWYPARSFDNNAAAFSQAFYRVVLPLIVETILVLLPSLWGMRRGFRMTALSRPLQTVVWIAVIATIAALVNARWIQLHFHAALLPLCAAGPIAYTLAAANSRRRLEL